MSHKEERNILLIMVFILCIAALVFSNKFYSQHQTIKQLEQVVIDKSETIVDIQYTLKMYEKEINEAYNIIDELRSE